MKFKFLNTALAGALLFAFACHQAIAAPILDQSYGIVGSASGPEVRLTNTLSQTFTVGISGYLDSIQLWNHPANYPADGLTIEIRTTENGAPTQNILASSFLLSSEVGTSSTNLTGVSFSNNSLYVNDGDLLAIVLSSESALPAYYNWWGNTFNPYARGEGLQSNDNGQTWNEADSRGFDFHFWTYVNPVEVSEPSTLAILALGLMGLASRRFKKQS